MKIFLIKQLLKICVWISSKTEYQFKLDYTIANWLTQGCNLKAMRIATFSHIAHGA